MKTFIDVPVRVVGWHQWPEATALRSYLATPHRHVFHVRVTLEVAHGEREVEFHDLQDAAADMLNRLGKPHASGTGRDFGAMSCERIAVAMVNALRLKYGVAREVRVSVREDDEVGAIVEVKGTP